MRDVSNREEIEAQYAALTERVALVDGDDRRIVVATGDRPVAMLNGLVTNDLGPLESNRAVFALALTPKGRPIAEMRILSARGLWLDTPKACLEPMIEHLRKYVPPLYASFDPTDAVSRLSVVGPRSRPALAGALDALGWICSEAAAGPSHPLEVAEVSGGTAGPTFVVRREDVEGPGYDVYVSRDDLSAAREALAAAVRAENGGVAGPAAYEIWRVERGIPVFGEDFGPDNLPQETGLEERAISYEKGCYTGQEVVARIHYRGHVNRHLSGLTFSPDSLAPVRSLEALQPGASLYRGDRPAGTVTTAVRSPRLGEIALGYVRREVEPDEGLAIEPHGPPCVRVSALPFTTT